MNRKNTSRRPVAYCSQPGCRSGAEYKVIASGKYVCARCASLFPREALAPANEAAK